MKHLQYFIILATGLCTPVPAFAERPDDRIWLQAGAFFTDVDSKLRYTDEKLGLQGTNVDFEGDLGLKKHRIEPKISGGFRVGDRFRLEGDYFRLKRSGSQTLDIPLQVDDTSYPVGLDVFTNFNTNIYRITAGYSPVKTDRAELGVAVGVHLTDYKFNIVGAAVAGGVGVVREKSRSGTVPLPNIGAYGSYALNKMFALEGRVDALSLKVGKYKGNLVDARLGVTARIIKNVGIGAAYHYVDYSLRDNKRDKRLKLDYSYKGPVVYAELAF